jgi:microcystin-dependent protein
MLASDMLNLVFFPKGAILMYDGTSWQDNVTLKGWYKCEGQTVAGYGVLPDLKNRFVIGYDGGSRTGGNNSLTLSTANLPEHGHGLSITSVSGLTLDNAGAHTHTLSGTAAEGGSHNHTLSNGSAAAAGGHSHSFSDGSTASAGSHSHTYNTIEWNKDGGDIPVNSEDDDAYTVSGTTSSTGAHTHTVSGTISTVDAHTHTVSGDISSGGAHDHILSGTAAEGGSHTHTVNSSSATISGSVGNTGSGTAFDNRPSYYALIYIIKVTEAGS